MASKAKNMEKAKPVSSASAVIRGAVGLGVVAGAGSGVGVGAAVGAGAGAGVGPGVFIE